MKKSIFLYIVFILINLASPYYVYTADGNGPLLTRNNYPPLLLFLQIPNDVALDVKKGNGYIETSISHSNVFSGEDTEEGSVSFDMEITRVSNRWVYGVTDNIVTGIEIPFLYMWSGFTDGLLQEFHKLFGLPNQNRENSSDYFYLYMINKGEDRILNQEEDVVGIGDVSVFIDYNIAEKKNYFPHIGIISSIKFPSGDTGLLYGSGKYDFGIGLEIKQSFSRFILYSITGLVYPGKPDFLDEIDIKPFITESLSLEYISSKDLSLLVQLDFNSNPYYSGIPKLDKESLEAILGIKRRVFKRYLWNISFTENLTAETIVDYTLQTGIGMKF